jgi:phosphomannomutase
MTHRFDPTSLREYDIRGVVGKTLSTDDARAIGRTFATIVRRAGGTRVAVGRDGRTSSPAMETALVEGLLASGVNVVRTGMGPTPQLYWAEAELEVDGGIQITGSHNPAEYNGFKMVLQHLPFFGEDIQKLGQMAADGDWDEAADRFYDPPDDEMCADCARLISGEDVCGICGATMCFACFEMGAGVCKGPHR